MRRFLLVWLGQTLSFIGSQLTAFGLGMWLYQRTGSAALYGLSLVAAVGPHILLAPLAGGLVDQRGYKQVLLLANCGSGACILAVAALLWLQVLPLWGLFLALAGHIRVQRPGVPRPLRAYHS